MSIRMLADQHIKVTTVNCRGMNGLHKRRDVLNFLRNTDGDIFFLQDIHIPQQQHIAFETLWRGKAFFSSYSNDSRGVCILFKEKFHFDSSFVHRDCDGNLLIVKTEICDKNVVLVSVYGPNIDSPDFYKRLGSILDEINSDIIIMGGDFNLVMNQLLDTKNYQTEHNTRARSALKELISRKGLIDIWRHMNPVKTGYTWTKQTPFKQSRLDMFFIDEHITPYIKACKIMPGYRTDHSRLELELCIEGEKRGPGLWKLNVALLNEDEYIELIRQTITSTTREYAAPVYSPQFFEMSNVGMNVRFTINDSLFFDTLMMKLRNVSVMYGKRRARKLRQREQELLEKIEMSHENVQSSQTSIGVENLVRLQGELESMRKCKIDGLLIRSRAKWHAEGEKPSKHFLSLEKYHNTRKTINWLEHEGRVVRGTRAIIEEFSEHLSTRYKGQLQQADEFSNISEFCPKKLSSAESNALEEEITIDELTCVMRNMKSGKSPGSSGFTIEFFRHFWEILKHSLHRSILYATANRQLSITQREGIITLIPKDKSRAHNIKGWRAISLLNIDYKIFSAVIAKRLKCVMQTLIGSGQTAYMRGRFIGENSRLTFDIIEHFYKRQKSGVLMAVDFETAFEAISWSFLKQVLILNNFGPKFRALCCLLYMNPQNYARIMYNGFLGTHLKYERGLRQGDPASGYLFILGAEIMSNMVQSSTQLKGLNVGLPKELRISQYADDTLLFLEATKDSVNGAFSVLNEFGNISGLRPNPIKTKCLPIGNASEARLKEEVPDINWVSKLKVLGITFSRHPDEIADLNIKGKIDDLNSVLAVWRRRSLSLIGSITVVKSLGISKLVHLFSALPSPSKACIKQIQQTLYDFLWRGKPDKVKRTKLVQSYTKGGLDMIDVDSFEKCQKINWLRRLVCSDANWANFAKAYILPSPEKILQFGAKKLDKVMQNMTNSFWLDVLSSWSEYNRCWEKSTQDILTEQIWFSDYTPYPTSIVKEWDQRGLRFIIDLIDPETKAFRSRDDLHIRHGITINFLDYQRLKRHIERSVQIGGLWRVDTNAPIYPARLKAVFQDKRLGKTAYKAFIKNIFDKHRQLFAKTENKWIRDVGKFERGSQVDVNRCTESTNLRWFHYRLVNRLVTTNHFLHIIKRREDDRCSFCRNASETLVHLFYRCPKTKSFLENVCSFLRSKNIFINIVENELFFPTDCSNLEHLIILSIKVVIYTARCKGCLPTVSFFEHFLKMEALKERYIARIRGKEETFRNKWKELGRALVLDQG